jgi:hypothetical protein
VHCSKTEALRLLRKLVVANVLGEETFRQDNQYGSVMSFLTVNEPVARALLHGSLRICMPFAVAAQPEAKKKFPRARKARNGTAALESAIARQAAGAGAATEADVETIEDDDTDDSNATQVCSRPFSPRCQACSGLVSTKSASAPSRSGYFYCNESRTAR